MLRQYLDDAKHEIAAMDKHNKPTERQERSFVIWNQLSRAKDSFPEGTIRRLAVMFYAEVLRPERPQLERGGSRG